MHSSEIIIKLFINTVGIPLFLYVRYCIWFVIIAFASF